MWNRLKAIEDKIETGFYFDEPAKDIIEDLDYLTKHCRKLEIEKLHLLHVVNAVIAAYNYGHKLPANVDAALDAYEKR